MRESNKPNPKALTPFNQPITSRRAENAQAMTELLARTPHCVWTQDAGDHPDNPPSCYRDGKRHGVWELRYADGDVWTGPIVNDQAYGWWELHCSEGGFAAGLYMHGERHGVWKFRDPMGSVGIGPYVHGARHGQWEMHWYDGTVACITYDHDEEVSTTEYPGE